jgi:hypothetical protein
LWVFGKNGLGRYGTSGSYRIGVNAEPVRHVIQNRVAHDIMTGGHSKWFQVMNKTWYPYFSYKTKKPYTLW